MGMSADIPRHDELPASIETFFGRVFRFQLCRRRDLADDAILNAQGVIAENITVRIPRDKRAVGNEHESFLFG